MNNEKRWACEHCALAGLDVSFAHRQSLYKHKKANHPELSPERQRVHIIAKSNRVDQKELEIQLLRKKLEEKDVVQKTMIDQIGKLGEQISELSQKVQDKPLGHAAPVTNITNNINQTINIYFNKDLKYYPELVKVLGKELARDFLLFKMPESKDLFGVLDKIFVRDGISSCPIQLDGNEFIIARGENQYDIDPTGELIDRENKNKLKDAVMSAYIESTRHLADECEKIRKTRVNGDYSDVDQETINKRFDYLIEPSRPYTVIDTMNAIKPKKKDFDRLRKICPVVVKKPVIN